MLTSDEVSLELLKKSIQMGAILFFPKELLQELSEFLEKLILDKWKPDWMALFGRVDLYISKYFKDDHKAKEIFFKELGKTSLNILNKP